MLPARPFYMIRHGQSTANAQELLAGGGWDAELTDLGRQQAKDTQSIFQNLAIKPSVIIHSHLIRARDTARIINETLHLPLHEIPDVAEHNVGEWEGQPWDITRPLLDQRIDPPGGESHVTFRNRVKRGITHAIAHSDDPVLIVCHGGVFRGLGDLYGLRFHRIDNCVLYQFTPIDAPFPWQILRHGQDGQDHVTLDIPLKTASA